MKRIPRSSGAQAALKSLAKELIWLCNVHRPGPEKNIGVFSSRRSGSTYLMELLSANRGIKYSAQPLSVYRASPLQLRYLPIRSYSQVLRLTEAEEVALREYLEGLLSGRVNAHAAWKFWKPGYRIRTDRVVLKELDAKALIDWFDRTFDLHVVYSTRHPIPSSLSLIRNGWGFTAEPYLQDGGFVEEYLGADNLGFCRDVLRAGSLLEKHVLSWAVENLVPIRLLPRRPDWVYVSYEELITGPDDVIDRLSSSLHLRDVDRMRAAVRRPSKSTARSSTAETRERIQTGDSGYLLGRWRQRVTPAEEAAVLRILEKLGIDLYRAGEDLPTLARPCAAPPP